MFTNWLNYLKIIITYHRELIGSQMTQFHNDFEPFPGAKGVIHSRKLFALCKKLYLDVLVDEEDNEGFHIRMKALLVQVIINKAKRLNISIKKLYELLYKGEEISFNMLDGSTCFRKNKFYKQIIPREFMRKVKF